MSKTQREIFWDENSTKILLAILFVINICWFYPLKFNTIMGDDLVRWSHFTGHGSFVDKALLYAPSNKYRPIWDIVQFIQFKLFNYHYQLFFYFNILFNFIVASALFSTVKRCTKNNWFIAFFISIIYLTSRFSYYSVLQVNASLEALSVLLVILIVRASIEYFITQELKYVFYFLLLNLIITFTHERFIVLVLFLLILLYIKKPYKYKKIINFAVFFPFLLLVVLKKIVFNSRFFEGTAGVPIDFNPVAIIKFVVCGFLNMFSLNVGPSYLNGIPIFEVGAKTHFFSAGIVALYIVVFALVLSYVRKLDSRERKDQVIIFMLWIVLFFSLILAASVTIRQELRWLYAPFVVFLIYFSYLLSIISLKPTLKYLLLVIICLFIVRNDVFYKENLSQVFFVYSQKVSDALYEETVKKYGTELKNYSLYIENSPFVDWPIQGSLFFVPYLGEGFKVHYVDDIQKVDLSEIDKNKVILLKLVLPELRFVEVNKKDN